MRKINLVLQEILKSILFFLLFFIWFRFLFKRNLFLAIILSILASISLYLLLFFLAKRKRIKMGLKIKEKEDAENMFLSLAGDQKYMDFFEKLAKSKHENVTKHKSYLTISHPENVKTVLYVDLSFEGITCDKIFEIYNNIKKENATKIVVLCKEISDKKVLSLLNTFQEKFIVYDEYQTYEKLYKFYNIFPKITRKYPTEKKLVFKDFFSYSFNKKRTKGYLFSAIILIISSLFLRTTIYYCIIASLLVVFALISQFNPRFNPKESPEVL